MLNHKKYGIVETCARVSSRLCKHVIIWNLPTAFTYDIFINRKLSEWYKCSIISVASGFMAGDQVTRRLTKTNKLLDNNRNDFFLNYPTNVQVQ